MIKIVLLIVFAAAALTAGLWDYLKHYGKHKPTGPHPWMNRPSIYSHIKANIGGNGKLTQKGDALPDEEMVFKPGDVRWISGGMDGAFAHHAGGQEKKKAKKIAALLNGYARTGKFASKLKLYNM
jgi:hypothetical protein